MIYSLHVSFFIEPSVSLVMCAQICAFSSFNEPSVSLDRCLQIQERGLCCRFLKISCYQALFTRCVFVYVCVHVCVLVREYVSVNMFVCVRASASACVWVKVYVHLWPCVSLLVCKVVRLPAWANLVQRHRPHCARVVNASMIQLHIRHITLWVCCWHLTHLFQIVAATIKLSSAREMLCSILFRQTKLDQAISCNMQTFIFEANAIPNEHMLSIISYISHIRSRLWLPA